MRDLEKMVECPFKTQAELYKYLEQRVYPRRSKWYGYDVDAKRAYTKNKITDLTIMESFQVFIEKKGGKFEETKIINFIEEMKSFTDQEFTKFINKQVQEFTNGDIKFFDLWTFDTSLEDYAKEAMDLFFLVHKMRASEKRSIPLEIFQEYKFGNYNHMVKILIEKVAESFENYDKSNMSEEKIHLMNIMMKKDNSELIASFTNKFSVDYLFAALNNLNTKTDDLLKIEASFMSILKKANEEKLMINIREALELHPNYKKDYTKNVLKLILD